jgi:hypothetical protein
MSGSYSQDRDLLNAYDIRNRAVAPARFAQAVTPNDSTELPVYGRLIVTNSHATSTENIFLIMASNNQDDSTVVAFPIAPLTPLVLPVVVRRVMATGTGGNVSAILLV